MDHANTVEIEAIDFVPETLINGKIFGAGDQKIGRVSHVHGLGAASKVVVDVGGFLGAAAKPVQPAVTAMVVIRDDNGHVHGKISWTKEQIKALPEHGHSAGHRPPHPQPGPADQGRTQPEKCFHAQQ